MTPYKLHRFVVRIGRVLAGVPVALVALYLLWVARDVFTTRLADLTVAGLGGGMLAALMGIVIAVLAWEFAFGPAPRLSAEQVRAYNEQRSVVAAGEPMLPQGLDTPVTRRGFKIGLGVVVGLLLIGWLCDLVVSVLR